jgi:hypothetical protein
MKGTLADLYPSYSFGLWYNLLSVRTDCRNTIATKDEVLGMHAVNCRGRLVRSGKRSSIKAGESIVNNDGKLVE